MMTMTRTPTSIPKPTTAHRRGAAADNPRYATWQ
jgi:hypothetical protein